MNEKIQNLFWIHMTIVVSPFLLFTVIVYPLYFVSLKPLFFIADKICKSNTVKEKDKTTLILINGLFWAFLGIFIFPTVASHYNVKNTIFAEIFFMIMLAGSLFTSIYFTLLSIELQDKKASPTAKKIARVLYKIACAITCIVLISTVCVAQPTIETKEYKYIDNPVCYEITILPTDSLQLDVWIGNLYGTYESKELVCLGVRELIVYTDLYPYLYCTVYNRYGQVSYGELYNAAYKPKNYFFITMPRFRREMVEYNPLDDIIPWIYKKY